MARPLHIAAITGGRADWGLLSMPLLAMRGDTAFAVSLVVTGQHLAPGEEASLAAIRDEGFDIAERVDIEVGDDSALGIARSTGLAVERLAAALGRLAPDLVLLLGDRYEILAAATAALFARVPVAHLCGGDITEGAMDEAIRHAITKLSHLHFVTHKAAFDRVLQLGEDPARVHCVGSPGLDRIRRTPVMAREELLDSVGLDRTARHLLLVTYHPVTLDDDPLPEPREMLAALATLKSDTAIIVTGSNADPGARGIDGLISAFVSARPSTVAVRTLGARRYFSAAAHADVVVGNSSSGLYEVPSFGTPTVDIGDRQKGRLRARSVIHCAGERSAIRAAIDQAFKLDCTGVENPYGDGHASERIVGVLRGLRPPLDLVRKQFHDIARGGTS